ncbi:cytochrome P450 monooxygenase-like protein [Mytilinidion resinicola]|uniref:Cytochrome P450 monooxygenase-like protein n=1 Tax=Mytilinidion resinicola TaxID=574789 RepID=A0A6A6YWX5_9PEZI|nr:cytochrome P450 monooxygenase-like protein [Mytilinidion resinicola]KAF2812407.1 cytochrome P450 monooxygenase-like protein [Mytilinidion resinicola]
MLPILPLFLIVSISYLVYTFLITPFFLSPLRHLPAAHWTARYSSLWINLQRYRSHENAAIWGAHRHLGPIVQLGPNEVSVNCIQGGLREVYAGGMEKPPGEAGFYNFFQNFGIPNMFSTSPTRPHSHRKRLISSLYSKTTLATSPALAAQTSLILYTRLLPALSATQPTGGTLNIYALLSAATMDIVTAYLFGLRASSTFLLDPAARDRFLGWYTSRHGFSFWGQEHPTLSAWVHRFLGIRLSPAFVGEANAAIEAWALEMCDTAAQASSPRTIGNEKEKGEGQGVADTPTVYATLYAAVATPPPSSKEAVVAVDRTAHLTTASELLDHFAAGFDTSGITLAYAVHELSSRPALQAALRAELLGLEPPIIPASAPALPSAKAVDALLLLHAVVWETLRLHPAIPGPQPRVTPAGGCRLGPEGVWVPGGVRVSASAGLLHAEESVFERAGEWRPERWAEEGTERRREMDRWFWAFGSGGRMCVGKHLAIHQMKHILAAIYSNFTTSIVNDEGIEQRDAYTAPPTSDELIITLVPVSAG